MTEKVLDRYFDGFPAAQLLLRTAIARGIDDLGLDPLVLAQRARVPAEVLGDILSGHDYIDQDMLENLSFPLGLMPNAILKPNMTDRDFEEWGPKLGYEGAGVVDGTGAPGKVRLPDKLSREECESTMVLLALREMDQVIEKIRHEGGGEGNQ